jgi:hypothetical protein
MRCIICDQERAESEEHIFPLAIGGCLATLRVCGDCNSKLGARIDAPLVDHLAIVMRREELKIAGRGGVPSTFDRVIGGRSALAREQSHQLRTKIDPTTNKLDIRTIPNISKVTLPDGRVADQLRMDIRDINKLGEIARKFRERRGLPPLTDAELDKLMADAQANAIENVNPEVIANIRVDPIGFMKCLVKIAYELAFCWLGEDYLNDPIAKKTKKYLLGIMNEKNITQPTLPMMGTISFDVIKPLEMWSTNKNLHIAYANRYQNQIVICLKLFDIFYACLVVSDVADGYLTMGISDQKLRFLAIDPVAGAKAESSFMEEMGRAASIVLGHAPNSGAPSS